MKKQQYLLYLIRNCIKDFKVLKKVNEELNNGMKSPSDIDVNYLGSLNRCVQGYLKIKVASLFDRNKKSISLSDIITEKEVKQINDVSNDDSVLTSDGKFHKVLNKIKTLEVVKG